MRHDLMPACLCGLVLTMAGCAAAPPSAPPAPVMPGADLAEPCRPFAGDAVSIGVDAAIVRPGDTAPIRASVRRNHAPGYQMVPAICLSDWRASPAQAATVAPDGSTVRFAADVPAGTAVMIQARTPAGTARTAVTIAANDEAPLAGRYSQTEVTCSGPAPRQPVRELRFSADGRFSVTWTPFETYEDYWGDYAVAPDGRTLTLTITGGNRVPEGERRLGGTFELRPGERRLILNGLDLGDGGASAPGQACRYVFSGPSLQ